MAGWRGIGGNATELEGSLQNVLVEDRCRQKVAVPIRRRASSPCRLRCSNASVGLHPFITGRVACPCTSASSRTARVTRIRSGRAPARRARSSRDRVSGWHRPVKNESVVPLGDLRSGSRARLALGNRCRSRSFCDRCRWLTLHRGERHGPVRSEGGTWKVGRVPSQPSKPVTTLSGHFYRVKPWTTG